MCGDCGTAVRGDPRWGEGEEVDGDGDGAV